MRYFKRRFFVFLTFLSIILTGFSQSNSTYFSNYNFEYYLTNPDFTVYNQYVLDNYLFHPTINGLEKTKNMDAKSSKFNLSTDLFVSGMNFTFRVHPSFNYKKFNFGFTLPYNFLVTNTFNKIGDIMLYSSYTVKTESITNISSIALSAPTGQDRPSSLFYTINGSGSFDFLLSNKRIRSLGGFGFYNNLMIRYSLNSSRNFTFRYENSDYYTVENYSFSNGLLSQLSLGGWVEPLKNLNFHYGIGIMYKSLSKYSLYRFDSWDQTLSTQSYSRNNNDYIFSDFRLGITTRIKFVDISIFACNKVFSNYENPWISDFKLLIKLKWEIL